MDGKADDSVVPETREVPSRPVVHVLLGAVKRFFVVGLLLIVAGILLFGEHFTQSSDGLLGIVFREAKAACRDPGTQWMVFLCAGIYFVTFTVLGESRKEKGESGDSGGAPNSKSEARNPKYGRQRFSVSGFQHLPCSPDFWLCALLLIAALAYAFDYERASTSTQALLLLAGAAIGKGARLWATWGKADKGKHSTFNIQLPTSNAGHAGGVNELKGLKELNEEGVAAEAADHESKIENRKSTPPLSPITRSRLSLRSHFCSLLSHFCFVPWSVVSSSSGPRSAARVHLLLFVLLLLLGVAAVWHPEGAMQFQYRGLNRWSGPWDNPNIFGLLMGVGVVLAVGLFVQGLKFNVQRFKVCLPPSVLRPPSSVPGSLGPWSVVSWSYGLVVLACGTACVLGLLKSYSRGAWLGTACGLAVLAYQMFRHQASSNEQRAAAPGENIQHPTTNSDKSRAGIQHRMAGKERLRGEIVNHKSSIVNRLAWRPLSVVLLSVVVLAFWQFRHTEFHPVRRAFSVGNPNDFSWRNRVAAWEGALAMMADKPFTGFGWNQPERIYDQFYRPPKVSEGMAIQLNHYFILGMSLGLPALLCFIAYLWSVVGRPCVQSSTFDVQRFEVRCSPPLPSVAPRRLSLYSHFCFVPWSVVSWSSGLAPVCQSAAVVLLIGLWFDGGLFNLTTGALLWTLLELSRPSLLGARPSRSQHVAHEAAREGESGADGAGHALRPGVPRSADEALSCGSWFGFNPCNQSPSSTLQPFNASTVTHEPA